MSFLSSAPLVGIRLTPGFTSFNFFPKVLYDFLRSLAWETFASFVRIIWFSSLLSREIVIARKDGPHYPWSSVSFGGRVVTSPIVNTFKDLAFIRVPK